MKKLNKNNILTSRRGFSMTEVVIGLTIIIIVSAASLTLILQHSNAEINVSQTIEATNIAENAIECFDVANDTDKFEELFFTNIYGKTTIEPTVEEDVNGNVTKYTYTYQHKAIDVTIMIDVTKNNITIEALDPDDKSLFRSDSVTYQK